MAEPASTAAAGALALWQAMTLTAPGAPGPAAPAGALPSADATAAMRAGADALADVAVTLARLASAVQATAGTYRESDLRIALELSGVDVPGAAAPTGEVP